MPSGVGIDWDEVPGANGYVVYRGDLGCNRQQVPVLTVPSGTTSWSDDLSGSDLPRYYRIEAVGLDPSCRSAVSNCESAAGGPRLQLNGHRMIEVGPHVNGNGLLDPGETVQVPVTLFNGGVADAQGVSARVRTVDPVQGRVVEPVVSFPDMPGGTALESAAPHFELTLFESGVACGDTVPLEIEMNADGAATRTRQFSFALGSLDRDYPETDAVMIPWFTPDPVTSTQEVPDEKTIAALDVSVSISHANAAELVVELLSPEGTTVRLHDNSGAAGSLVTRYDLETEPDGPGTMADFDGESILGTWTLSVADTILGSPAPGTLQSWTLHVTSVEGFDCEVFSCAEPVPAGSANGFHVDKTVDVGDGSVDLEFHWDGVTGAAGYHVLHSSASTFGTVDLTGRTDGPTTLLADDGAATTPPVTFFQVRAVNACSQEGP
jgi:subtilisin-like proprotein convertase family protein